MANPLFVLVTGATGKQGGALARLLLKKGHRVRAFTRNPNSPAAEELKRLGAELVVDSFEDRTAIERAAQGTDAIFAMSTPFESGTEAETRQGITVANAAKAAGTRHLVFNSVASADRNTGIPHFDSKYKIEQHIASLDMPHTIIGPVFFMENLISSWWFPALQEGNLPMALPNTRKLHQIAVENIAEFTLVVMERREQFLGKRVDIASDELTGKQVVDVLSRVSGRKIEYVELPLEQLQASNEDFAKMFEWFDRVGYTVDIAALRRNYPEVNWCTFEDWAKAQNWNALKRAEAP